jgi:hypothetical protein
MINTIIVNCGFDFSASLATKGFRPHESLWQFIPASSSYGNMAQQINYHRKRTINFVIGIVLAVLHAAASVNVLNDNWRFENFSGTSWMVACVRAGWMAAGLAITVTIVALVLVLAAL